MNMLPPDRRKITLNMLVEGQSIRATARITGTSPTTVMKLAVDAGGVCADLHDIYVWNMEANEIQVDEIWSFCHTKEANLFEGSPREAGDVWTWTAIDRDTKLIYSYVVGDRTLDTALLFMRDLMSRLKSFDRIVSDGLRAYPEAIRQVFGNVPYCVSA